MTVGSLGAVLDVVLVAIRDVLKWHVLRPCCADDGVIGKNSTQIIKMRSLYDTKPPQHK